MRDTLYICFFKRNSNKMTFKLIKYRKNTNRFQKKSINFSYLHNNNNNTSSNVTRVSNNIISHSRTKRIIFVYL